MSYFAEPTCQIKELPQLMERHIGFRKRGTFVDVGAFDGIRFSNTWPLAQMGWQGLAIEPIRVLAEQAEKNYEGLNVTVLAAAIMSMSGYIPIYVDANWGPGSTTQKDLIPILNGIGGRLHDGIFLEVPAMTLDYALWVYGIEPEFDLLSIDVEGAEGDVLAGFDLKHYRPKLILIEMTRELSAIPDLMAAEGYEKVHSERSNWAFAQKWEAQEFI